MVRKAFLYCASCDKTLHYNFFVFTKKAPKDSPNLPRLCIDCASSTKHVWLNRTLALVRYTSSKYAIPFDIVQSKVVLPEVCPILGVEIDYTTVWRGGDKLDAPALDRNIKELGYVMSNITVISQKAHRIKADATLDELRAVVTYVEKNNGLRSK